MVTALEGRDERDLTVEYVTGKILDEYQRRTEASGASESNGGNSEVALKSAGNPSRINRGRNKNSFNKGTKSEKGGKGQRETSTCYYCHKPGHLKSECRWYKKVQDQKKTESANSTVAANAQSDKSQVAFEAKCGIESFGGWCVDSGATSHMTNQAKFFSSMRSISSLVYLANGSSVTATGIGSGYLQCKLRGKIQRIQLHDVLYVPQLDDSLLSVKRVIDKGYKMVIEENGCKIYKGKRVVAEAESDGTLYRLKVTRSMTSAYVA